MSDVSPMRTHRWPHLVTMSVLATFLTSFASGFLGRNLEHSRHGRRTRYS